MGLRSCLAGSAFTFALVFGMLGVVPRFVPTETVLGPLVRIFDSLAPWLIVLAMAFSLGSVVFGMRWAGGLLGLILAAGLAQLGIAHYGLTMPSAASPQTVTRVLFFNALGPDAARSRQIVSAALEEDADIIVFVEAGATRQALEQFSSDYDFLAPCDVNDCDVMVATKERPMRFWRLQLSPAWGERFAVAEIGYGSGKSFFLAASQIAKPWLSGLAESELARLTAQYNWLPGPAVAVGDFNAAPWSRPVQQLTRNSGVKGARLPPATWPASAGNLGVPIDLVFVKNGIRIVSVTPFGVELGSNHRGLVAEIELP